MNELRISKENKNENENGKELLYLFFYKLRNEIKGKKVPINPELLKENLRTTSFSQLIKYIEDSINILIKKRINQYKAENNKREKEKTKNEEENKAYYNNINNYDFILNRLKLQEAKERRLIQKVFYYNLQKEALNSRLNEYFQIEEEYEEMKAKFHYEEGKFLDNARKDSEIYILRKENSTLKQEVENKKRKYALIINDKDKIIADLQTQLINIKNKLYEKEEELKLTSNININIHNSLLNHSQNKKKKKPNNSVSNSLIEYSEINNTINNFAKNSKCNDVSSTSSIGKKEYSLVFGGTRNRNRSKKSTNSKMNNSDFSSKIFSPTPTFNQIKMNIKNVSSRKCEKKFLNLSQCPISIESMIKQILFKSIRLKNKKKKFICKSLPKNNSEKLLKQ